MLDHPNYWYKVSATGMVHNAMSFEGALCASTPQMAMTILERKQKKWIVTKINCVSIFEMDENGVISDEPEIFVNYMLKRKEDIVSIHVDLYKERLARVRNKGKDTHKEYDEASWCMPIKVPQSFMTLTHKQETNHDS